MRVRGADHPLPDEGFGVNAGTVPAAHGDDYLLVADGTAWPDPCSRWQPYGLRGPSASLDPARVDVDRRGFRAAALRTRSSTSCTSGRSRGEGRSTPRSSTCRRSRSSASPSSRSCRSRSSPASAAGATTACTWARAVQLRRPRGPRTPRRRRPRRGPRRHPRRRLQPRRRLRSAGARGVRPVLHRSLRHVLGRAPSTTTTRSRRHPRVGRAERRGVGPRPPPRRAAPRRHPRRSTTCRPGTSSRSSPPACTPRGPARSSSPRAGSTTRRSCARQPRRLGRDAAWADDFHHALRTLLTGERDGYYAEFGHVAQLAKAFRRPHVHDGQYSTFRRRRFGAPAEDVPPERLRRLLRQPRPDRQPRVRGPAAASRCGRSPRSARCCRRSSRWCSRARSTASGAPFQFFTDHIDEEIAEATREGRRGEFASFAAFAGEDVPDPQARRRSSAPS